MSVIGIDFGNESCYIAVARQGGIETIANDYSLRATPSVVAFGEKNRMFGVAAKNQLVTNLRNTVVNFKRLVGKQYRDHRVTDDLKSLACRTVEQKDGTIGIVVQYCDGEHTFTPTQITAMMFTKLKHTAENALGVKVVDVVIGVPCYYDDAERHAMIEAATAAGLNVLRLINETTAVALAYGIYKQDLPQPEEKPRNVVFVDCGQSSFQVSVVAFNRGKLKMLTTGSDPNLGGRDFDQALATYFANDFKARYKIDVLKNPRAWIRLLAEVEKLKKQMSANSTDLPLNIECFMDDKDVSSKLNRAQMEDMCMALFSRVEMTLQQCFVDSGLKLEEIYSVELVGGSSRVPAIKNIIEKIFKKVSSTTLNQDEAVARGCALQCAMLSPTFKVREFSITDVQPHSIRLLWRDDNGQDGDMEVFPKHHPIPFSKMLSFYRKGPFVLQAQYAPPSPNPDPVIGNFTIENITPTPEGESQKVKVKVRINLHGLFTVASASLTEKLQVQEENQTQPMESEDNRPEKGMTNGPDSEQEPTQDQQQENEQEANPEAGVDQVESEKSPLKNDVKAEAGAEKKPKAKVKNIDLPVKSIVRSLSTNSLNALIELEAKMVQADKLENERINAKNAVEEYVYDIREKICRELDDYVADNDKEVFGRFLTETENWLYEEGEDCQKHIYVEKLTELKKYGDPIQKRRREREGLPLAFESFCLSLQLARKAYEGYKLGHEKYDHLDEGEMQKVEKMLFEKEQWVDQQLGIVKNTPRHKDVPVTASQVYSEKSTFEAIVHPVINKPKPKPKVEEPPPAENGQTESEKNPTQNEEKRSEKEGSRTKGEPMDVD